VQERRDGQLARSQSVARTKTSNVRGRLFGGVLREHRLQAYVWSDFRGMASFLASGLTYALVTAAICSSANGAMTATPPSRSDPGVACASLSGVAIPSSQIGMPTSGARVVNATLQLASAAGGQASPEYCKVLAQIDPVDSQAQSVNIQLNLPTLWNGKVVQMGGGGLDGFLVSADGAEPGASSQPTPLSLGFATFGSDGGHRVANPFDVEQQTAAFLNDEVLTNYVGAQLKKTHDLAIALIQLHYNAPPRRIYFVGASGGGREALIALQRWGAEYDGAVAYYPAAGGVPLLIALGRDARALALPGAYPNPAKQALLHRAVTSACDAADGAVDGIIANPESCRFDVAQIRCQSGVDENDSCLSDAQITALKVMSSDLRLRYPLASGERGFPGYHVFQGVDLTAPVAGLGSRAPTPPPVLATEPIHYLFYSVFVRGMLARNLQTDPLTFDPENPRAWSSRMSELSVMLQAAQADLSSFERHGGKVIIVHGNDDPLIPVGWTENYYESVVRKMGQTAVDQFVRFYAVPGYGHGTGTFVVDWDSLSALDQWVETSVAPTSPVSIDANPATRGRTRPLCRYPLWPKYASGDVNAAASFVCAPASEASP